MNPATIGNENLFLLILTVIFFLLYVVIWALYSYIPDTLRQWVNHFDTSKNVGCDELSYPWFLARQNFSRMRAIFLWATGLLGVGSVIAILVKINKFIEIYEPGNLTFKYFLKNFEVGPIPPILLGVSLIIFIVVVSRVCAFQNWIRQFRSR